MSESLESPGGLEGLGGPQDSFETTDISKLPKIISEPVTSTITSSTSSKRSSVYQHFTFDEKTRNRNADTVEWSINLLRICQLEQCSNTFELITLVF